MILSSKCNCCAHEKICNQKEDYTQVCNEVKSICCIDMTNVKIDCCDFLPKSYAVTPRKETIA